MVKPSIVGLKANDFATCKKAVFMTASWPRLIQWARHWVEGVLAPPTKKIRPIVPSGFVQSDEPAEHAHR